MRKHLFLFVALLAILHGGCASTRGNRHGGNLEKQRVVRNIEEIIKATDPNVNIGIKIASLSSSDVMVEKNSGRHFIPSSTIKLFTLAAALHYLGPSFRFSTTILSDGLIDKTGNIKNLYIRGSGDPSLMDHELIALVYELKQMGIHQITGNIYVDDQIFDDVLWGRGTMWDDRKHGYSAPVAGLNLNYNRLQIKTVPSRHEKNSLAHAVIKPATSFVEIVQNAKTLQNPGKKEISVAVLRAKHREEDWPSTTNDGLHYGDKVILDGQISKTSDAQYNMLAINDPGMLVGVFLKDQLARVGIKVKGTVVRKSTPADAVKLVSHESRSLAEALIDFTKISNNIANDALIKAMAAQAGTRPATLSAGLKLVNDFLVKEVGLKPNSLVTADGAGLSRYNLVTPEQMVQLLTYAANHFHMAPEFMAALPIGGEDGLLSGRLTGKDLKGNVRAKTGTMSGLSSLCGYLTGIDGKRYVFAIMINGFIGNVSKYTRMQDQILATMLTDDQSQFAKVK